MKKYIAIAALVLACITVNAQAEIKHKDLDWVLGQWKLDAGETQIFENWKKGGDNSYIGDAYVIQGKDTVVTELIKIEKVGNHWVYIAQVNDGNPVLFTLKSGSTAKELTFENLEHDNPQRVIYKFVNKNELYARTEAIVEGKEMVDEYPYTRR